MAREHSVAPADLDADGVPLDPTVERWILAACDEYLDLCTALRAVQQRERLAARFRIGALPDLAALGAAPAVLVSARATEFFPDSFMIAVRLRGPDGVVDALCAVELEDEGGNAVVLSHEIRDELIALEHAASHVN